MNIMPESEDFSLLSHKSQNYLQNSGPQAARESFLVFLVWDGTLLNPIWGSKETYQNKIRLGSRVHWVAVNELAVIRKPYYLRCTHNVVTYTSVPYQQPSLGAVLS